MAKQSGKEVRVYSDGVDLSVSLRGFTVSYGQNVADSTAGADEYENSVPTTKTVTASATAVILKDADGGVAQRTQMKVGNEVDLTWGWQLAAAGTSKGGIEARVTKFEIKGEYTDVVIADVEWVNIGEDLLFDETVDTW